MAQFFYSFKRDPTGNTPGIEGTIHSLDFNINIDTPRNYTLREILNKIDELRRAIDNPEDENRKRKLQEISVYAYIASFYIPNFDTIIYIR